MSNQLRKKDRIINFVKIGDNVLKSKVKPMCETRWVERHTALEDLANL